MTTAPGISADQRAFWRAASISKVVVGRVAHQVLDGASDISTALGWPLRHPHWPDQPITVAQVVSHQSGLSDHDGYAVSMDQTLAQFMGEGDHFTDPAPGAAFEYSNLGYLVLATAIEAAAGESLSALAQHLVFDPLGIEAGFNWDGLRHTARDNAAPIYRRAPDGQYLAQIDNAIAPQGISDAHGKQTPDVIGRAQRLSPQGGLRLSLEGALTLAKSLPDGPRDVLWRPTMGPTDTAGGVMDSYGWGVQMLDDPPFYPRPLIGHFANAYGFSGGVWHDPEREVSFAIALNGRDLGDEGDELSAVEREMFARVARWVDQGA